MRKIIKISALIMAVLILLTSIVLIIFSCLKTVNSDSNDSINDQFETNEDILKLKTDTWDIEVNTYKEVFFQATVSENINGTIELRDENDNTIGNLVDNGTNGDEVADDGVYSGRFNLFSEQQQIKKYYCVLDNIKSNTIEISFYKQLQTRDYEIVNDIRDKINHIESKYIQNNDGTVNHDSAKMVYNELLQYFEELKEKNILKNYENVDGEITLELYNGVVFSYTFDLSNEDRWNDIDTNSDKTQVKNSSKEYESNSEMKKQKIITFAHSEIPNVTDESAKLISSHNYYNYSFSSNLDDNQVTIETMKNLSNYNIIIITTHGGYSPAYGSRVLTGEKDELNKIIMYSADIVAKRIIVTKDGYYAITPNFFEKYYEDNSFDNALVYLGVCHSADDSRLADMLIKKGVAVVLGYKNSVTAGYETKMSQTFFNLLCKNKSKRLSTVNEAYIESKEINGKKDTPYSDFWTYLFEKTDSKFAELKLFGNKDYTILDWIMEDSDNYCLIEFRDIDTQLTIPANCTIYRLNENKNDSFEKYSYNKYYEEIFGVVLPNGTYKVDVTPFDVNHEKTSVIFVQNNSGVNTQIINLTKRSTITYTNNKYGWSVELPEEWNKYGTVIENNTSGYVGFYHKELYEKSGLGRMFTIDALPPDKYEELSPWTIDKLAENSEYVFFWTWATDLQVDINDKDFERLYEEYNILYNTRDSIIESFKLLE